METSRCIYKEYVAAGLDGFLAGSAGKLDGFGFAGVAFVDG